MKKRLFFSLMTSSLAVFAFSTAWAELPQVKKVPEKPVIPFEEGAKGRVVSLQTIKTRFDEKVKIGELQKGWLCSKSGDIVWNKKVYELFKPKLGKVFQEELEAAHYPTPTTSDAIFETKEETKPGTELQVGMFIKEVGASFCMKSSENLGGVYMKIFWQVFAPEGQKVVFQTTTEGSYQPEVGVKDLPDEFFLKAFRVATRNLLAQKGLHDAVLNTEAIKPSTEDAKALKLEGATLSKEPLAKHITGLRSAVVTIVGDSSTGSGFFISKEGHLLTNYHVAGAKKFLKVKLSTGRELVGEVIRSDKERDVALIKTEQIGVTPMGIRTSESNIGEDVYVLGSPLGEKFNTSLTKGILSGYRSEKENRYLQSDVSILPGDSGGPLLDAKGAVIGITVAGLGAKGLAGMNFFIPINDALTKLGVELSQGSSK